MEFRELIEEVKGLRMDLQAIREEIEHYRGFVAGVAWCFASIAAAIGFVYGMIFGN